MDPEGTELTRGDGSPGHERSRSAFGSSVEISVVISSAVGQHASLLVQKAMAVDRMQLSRRTAVNNIIMLNNCTRSRRENKSVPCNPSFVGL